MKILWLGNSNDQPSAEVPESALRHKLLEPRLAEAIGESVEITARQFWPTPDAAKVVEGFMTRYAPDVVYLGTNSFWFNHESVPLRLERALGPFGSFVRRTALNANGAGWFAHNRAYRSVRDFARRHIDGAYHFEPEEVVQRMAECIRVVLRSEGALLLVRTPSGKRDTAPTPKVRDRREARRLQVHLGLKKLCDELHVDYLGSDRPSYIDRPLGPEDPALLQGDAFHRNAAGHRDDVDQKFQLLLPICLKALEARAGQPSGSPAG